jgi:hypothetical protein
MTRSLCIYHPPGVHELPANPFGKDVANLELFRALARHGGFDELSVLSVRRVDEGEMARTLLGDAPTAAPRLTSASVMDGASAARSGAQLRAAADL